jgi:hypothetical protein
MEEAVKEILLTMSLNQYKTGIKYIHKGHSVYSLNINTGDIDGPLINGFKYIFGFIYMPALNIQNAEKRFDKVLKYAENMVKELTKATPLSSLGAGKDNTQLNT